VSLFYHTHTHSEQEQATDKIALLHSDALKYRLLNILQQPLDHDHYMTKRLIAYRLVYRIAKQNTTSQIKAHNLYALLYSKYYTTRYIMQAQNPDPIFDQVVNDEALQLQFRELLAHLPDTQQEFDKKYLALVKNAHSMQVYQQFEIVNTWMNDKPYRQWTADEGDYFFQGTSETDIFLHKQLAKDIKRFNSVKDNMLNFLKQYKAISSWVIAAGVGAFTLFHPLLSLVI
jgi:hypothetical protein